MTVIFGSKRNDYSCHASLVEQRNSGLASDETILPQADDNDHESESVESFDMCNCCNRTDGRCMCVELDIEMGSHNWCSYCYFTTDETSCTVCNEHYCSCPHDTPEHICHFMCEENFAYCGICSPRGYLCVGHDFSEPSSEDEGDSDWSEDDDDPIYPQASTDAKPQSPIVSDDFTDNSEDALDLLNVVGKIEGIDVADEWMSTLEGLILLLLQIIKAKDPADLVLALLVYIKSNTTRSLCGFIMEKLPEQGEDPVVPHAWTASDLKQKWHMLRTNAIFPRMGYLISAAISLTVCKINGVEWTMGGFEIFSLPAVDKQLGACSLIDAFVDVFEWTVNTGYKIIEQKSLNPLFYTDNRMEDFTNDYMDVVAKADIVLNGNGGDVSEFEGRVDNLLILTEHFRKLKANVSLNLWLQERYSVLISIKDRIVSKQRNTAIRFRPFGLGLTGPSGVGKSTLAKIVMKTALEAMGFGYDKDRIITKDMFDKYDSTYTSDILGMFLDDVGNGKAQFVVTSPTDVIIKFFNNMAATAVKAELAGKGVVFINFKVGVLTSNHRDYNVSLYTEIVEASLSRLIHTRVEVKEKYRKEGSVALNPSHPDLRQAKLTHDIWELSLEQSKLVPHSPTKNAHKFVPLYANLDGKMIKCTKLDLKTYLRVIVVLAQDHKNSQVNVMARSKEFDECPSCPKCHLVADLCDCKREDDCAKMIENPEMMNSVEERLRQELADEKASAMNKVDRELKEELLDARNADNDPVRPHSAEMFTEVASEAMSRAMTTWTSSFFGSYLTWFYRLKWLCGFRPVKKMTTRLLANELSYAMSEVTTPLFLAIMPKAVYDTTVFKYIRYRWARTAALYHLKPWIRLVSIFGVIGLSTSYYYKNWGWFTIVLILTYLMSLILYALYWARCDVYKREYMARKDAVTDAVKSIQPHSGVRKGAAALAVFIVALRAAKMWMDNRIEPNALVTDASPGWFGFIEKMKVSVGTQDRVKNASTTQVISKISKNVAVIEFNRPDGTTAWCNAFFPQKGVMWIPKHIFYTDCDMTKERHTHIKAKMCRGIGPGSQFEQHIASSMCVFTDIDLVVVAVSKCPDLASVYDFLPTSKPEGSCLAQLAVRNELFGIEQETLNVKFGTVAHTYMDFYGGAYTSKLARVGACMGPVVQDGKSPVILGFHIGGNNSQKGVMQSVTLANHQEWLADLRKISGNFVGSESNDLPEEIMGRPLITGPVHPHAEATRLLDSAPIVVLGSTKLRTKQKSCVVKSVLSDSVAEHFQHENKWGQPKLEPNWKCYNAILEHLANPGETFKPDELERARQDWLAPLLEKVGDIPDIRPLTLEESIMGIDGERFIDPIDMSTSMCHPLYGKKRGHFEDCWVNGKLKSRTPSEEIMFELERVEGCWKRGKRANIVWSSNLKDEPTAFDKTSVRVFQGSPVVLTILMRKYFLKIVRFLGLHSLEAECAVGVNAFGKEWQTMMEHSAKYSEPVEGGSPIKTDLGWDYSKYDVRMISQLTVAAYACMIDIARAHGYDPMDLFIMEMMLYDIVHPLLDFNGTMLQVFNMNTSGNSLTVIVNSIVGSLLVRMGFFHVYPDLDNFRDYVAALTYGDDFKGSVRAMCANFNFKTYRDFLALYGLKITHPDKSTDATEFLSAAELDFLKRMSNYIPEINRWIGMLCEDSIMKPLHVHLKSKSASMREVAVDAVENALHEWFAHGREVYEDRRSKLIKVCEDCSLPVTALDTDFDTRVLYWKEKYD